MTGTTRRRLLLCVPLTVLAVGACSAAPDSDEVAREPAVEADPQLVFWAALEELCGQAFAGQIVESVPPDDAFEGQSQIMHVRSCETGEIRIPYFVGEDRSRTWVVTTTAAGLRLKHDHRHEDGSEDEITQYGGDTEGRGTNTVQDFHADALTAELVPTAATNIWSIELVPGEMFAYALRREGRRFRVEFDLSMPVATPLPPWGG